MAPPPQKPSDMKQKSLMGYFGKPGANKASSTNTVKKATPVQAGNKIADTSSTPIITVTKGKAKPFEPASSSPPLSSQTTRSSLVAPKPEPLLARAVSELSEVQDTPPTSDPVDVEMASSGAEDEELKAPSGKRKKVVLESDEEALVSARKPSGRLKKPRITVAFSDEEDEEAVEASAALSQRISRFKKSPAKPSGRQRSRSRASDDDDFTLPKSTSPPLSRVSSRSSHRSSSPDSDADSFIIDDASDDVAPQKSSKSKSKATTKRPPAKPTGAAGTRASENGSSIFLTAAERRAQETKSEKKAADDPFEFLLDIRDKDGVRPGEPSYDPRTLYIPPKAWKTFTPFEKQFWEIKQNHFDTVLFFQKGKFLELYEDDARIGHQDFDLKLTQRVKMSMVGVPESSFNFWAAKFLAKGHKVGRVDQAETALGAEMRMAADKSKGKKSEDKEKEKIVRRELNKVYTNGTLVDDALLTDEQAGHCVAIKEATSNEEAAAGTGTFGLCVLDCSTSEFNLSSFEDDVCRTKLETMMRQLRPKELVFTKGNLSVSTTRLLKSVLPGSCLWTSLRDVEGFGFTRTLKELRELYHPSGGDEEMDGDGALPSGVPLAIRDMLGCREAVEALGSMMWYLRQLNIDKDILSMKNFNIYDPMKKGEGLVLDGQTLGHIEVLLNSDGSEDGSLLKLLSRCVTPFGKRLFRIWLCMPLREVKAINARLDAVQDLLDHPSFEEEFNDVTKGLPDLERIVSRIHAKNCKVKDFLKVLQAFRKLSKGLAELAASATKFDSSMISGLLRSAPDLIKNIEHVESMYQKPEKDTDELLPVDGKDEEYDGIAEEINGLEEVLETELKKLEKKVGTSLNYWHSAQGTKDIYVVQVKASFKDIPREWVRNGGTKAFTRWNVPALSSTVRQLKEARENRNTATKNFKLRVFAEFDEDRSVWLRAIRVLAELDCLFSLAKSSAALGEPSCRPNIIEGDAAFVDFEELRHPALGVGGTLKGDFIPNNVKLGGDVGRIALLTGPNMGGKSTAMRMTAAGVIMAQLGMMVPAKKARICPVDAILTRMGAYDNMFSNASTFKVELDESCKILREATPKSLVILDELGRGTSTYDGMAIAGAVLHQLATHTLSLGFFATHYGSLTDDFAYFPAIRNMHMATMLDDDKCELIFLYKLVEGVAKGSFGTHVAKLAGVPPEVVQRADVVSDNFAQQFKERVEGKKASAPSAALPLTVQADFAYLIGLASGKIDLPHHPVRRREVLMGLKAAVRSCFKL